MPKSYQEQSTEITLEIRNPSRSYGSPNEREMQDLDIDYWRSAVSHLGKREFTNQWGSFCIEVNWKPMIHRLQLTQSAMAEFEAAIEQGPDAVRKYFDKKSFILKPVKIHCKISCSRKPRSKCPSLEGIAESFFYDVFLIMNLAYPGAANFYSATLKPSNKIKFGKYQPKLELVGDLFELALLNQQKQKWPAANRIPLEDVIRWISIVRKEYSQVPSSRMEKVIFALLHISRLFQSSPTEIIWIFYALETLFDTKVGENFRTLIERIQLLLSPTASESKFLRKRLRQMYDVRSSFVHGGLDVVHPMHDENLDFRIDNQWRHLSELVNFGFALLVVSLQKIIQENWLEPKFAEVISGCPLPSETRLV